MGEWRNVDCSTFNEDKLMYISMKLEGKFDRLESKSRIEADQ